MISLTSITLVATPFTLVTVPVDGGGSGGGRIIGYTGLRKKRIDQEVEVALGATASGEALYLTPVIYSPRVATSKAAEARASILIVAANVSNANADGGAYVQADSLSIADVIADVRRRDEEHVLLLVV